MNISVLSTLLAGANGASQRSSMSMIILIVAMFGVMYFVMIRPQKKKQQQEQEMRDSIQVGDEITTIGGIMGRVVTVKEDSLVIETGADRNKMKITRWAVSTNNTAVEKAEAEKAAAKEAAEAEKNKKIEEAAEAGKSKRKKTKKNKDDTFED
ncbi:MAG: preprotein translocase subunit YajC [Clostridia bacterium]|nr:preprotein translocase subunit YajC [Clostridia bacterium]